MTHIATHPPGQEDVFMSASPMHKMFGYLNLADPAKNPDQGSSDFKVFFLNNTGYVFHNVTVACHFALFPINYNRESSFSDRQFPKGKPKFCAIAYDLVDYELHANVEKKAKSGIGNRKFEAVPPQDLRDYIDRNFDVKEVLSEERSKTKLVLEQSYQYIKSESFQHIKGFYNDDFNQSLAWMINNVLDFESMKKFIFGCGLSSGNEEIASTDEFKKFLYDRTVKMTS